MSTQAERHFRAVRRIMPVKIAVADTTQVVDCDVRRRKHDPIAHLREQEAVREVVRALNRFYYEQ